MEILKCVISDVRQLIYTLITILIILNDNRTQYFPLPEQSYYKNIYCHFHNKFQK